MGTYTPSKPEPRKTLADTLRDARNDHFLDCPDADFPSRAAAFLLDLIFFSLTTTAIHQLGQTIISSLVALSAGGDAATSSMSLLGIAYASWILKSIACWTYYVWTLPQFGGSPAKLLLGLRVIDQDHGDYPSFGRAFFRECLGKGLGVITGTSVVPLLRIPSKTPFHDWITRTRVKRVQG